MNMFISKSWVLNAVIPVPLHTMELILGTGSLSKRCKACGRVGLGEVSTNQHHNKRKGLKY